MLPSRSVVVSRRALRRGRAERSLSSPLFLLILSAVILLCGTVAAIGLRAAAPQAPPAAAHRARVIELRIGDEVEPIMAEYIDGGIDQAAREHADLVLITMDTPGGLEDSMMQIIQHILASPVPVVVYVSPTGARGASAGFFILESADVAAMAPGTHAGAAAPIEAVGGVPVNIDDTLKKKIMNDALAFLRSYADKRGRNVPLAETAVTDAKAFTNQEALDGKLINLVADSPESLLRMLDGRPIARFDGTTARLDLHDPQLVAVDMSARQKFLARIVQPDVFFILLIAGAIGLYVEFTHPGAVLPGVVGAICTVLALYAMHILPVNFAGLLLIVAAMAMFVLEAKFTSHGVLAVGGIIAMLIGALLLIRSPLTGAGVSLGAALGVTVPAALITVFLMRLVLRSRRWQQSTGGEELVGKEAEVTEEIAEYSEDLTASRTGAAVHPFRGMVRLNGELWRAVAPQCIAAGTRVRVVRLQGLTLHVEPAGLPAARTGESVATRTQA